jgi:glucokinase
MRYVGFDIGGTNIKAGLFDESGKILARRSVPTDGSSLDNLLAALKRIATDFHAETGALSGVGIGVPGLVSTRTGKIAAAPHVPCLEDAELSGLLSAALSLPVTVDNDANAGAYAEYACGAGKGLRHMAYITLGTGLGSGLILDGRLHRGATGYAAELGHAAVEPDGRPCDCGAHGCVETRVSATGMVRTAEELLAAAPASALHPDRRSGPLTAAGIYDAALAGDVLAREVFESTGRYLGIAAATLMNLLNLEAIVLGGGVMAAGGLLIEPAAREAQRRAFAATFKDCPIVQSQLWPDAGIIGAAMLVRDHVA